MLTSNIVNLFVINRRIYFKNARYTQFQDHSVIILKADGCCTSDCCHIF